MRWTSTLRAAAFERLPHSWQPVATYHYYRARSLLDPELAIVCNELRPGVRAIDVGANEGVYTHAFARTGAMVEAFEPEPGCLRVLRSYARSRPAITVHPEAVGSAPGMATLYVPAVDGRRVTGRGSLDPAAARQASGDPNSMDKIDVRVTTIDSFAFTDVAVIKIDVEGRELDVLDGARATVARWRPTLLVEIEQRHTGRPVKESFGTIEQLGYRGEFRTAEGDVLPTSAFDAAVHQNVQWADRPDAPYVNNFIFRSTQRR